MFDEVACGGDVSCRAVALSPYIPMPWMRVEAIGLLSIYNRILTLRSVRSPVVLEHACTFLFTHSLNV